MNVLAERLERCAVNVRLNALSRKVNDHTPMEHTGILLWKWIGGYPNLTRNFMPTARNQVWVANMTYIRLAEEFVYLKQKEQIVWNTETWLKPGAASATFATSGANLQQ